MITAGVPSSQAFPGFLITVPSSVCISALLGALAVGIQNEPKKNKKTKRHASCVDSKPKKIINNTGKK